MKQYRWLVALVAGAFLLVACGGLQSAVPDADVRLSSLGTPTYSEDWDGRGSESEKCRVPDADDPRFPLYAAGDGWIHWVFSTKGASNNARLYVEVDGVAVAGSPFEPGPPLNANVWHFYTPFFELDGLTATIKLYGGARGPGGGLVISDYCPGDKELSVDVRKTAFTEFTRTHEWDIAKKVETEFGYVVDEDTPKIWLYTDGSGDETATWTVDVTYKGYTDSDFVVFGEIEIENISKSEDDKVITSITDDLGFPGYDDIALDCGDDFELPTRSRSGRCSPARTGSSSPTGPSSRATSAPTR